VAPVSDRCMRSSETSATEDRYHPPMPTVVVSRPLHGHFEIPGAEVRTGPKGGQRSRDELLNFIAGADAVVSWVTERVDDAFLDAAGKQLKVVSNYAVGHDNIDLDACARRGVIVTNTPDAVTEGTADVAVMHLLAAARRLSEADRFVRSGQWTDHGILGPSEWLGQPIAGRTLLIIGAGRIGYATAVRMLGFGVRILYTSRSPKPNFEHATLCAKRVTLEEGLAEADFVSIHTPLTPETRHLINAERLATMKPAAVIVSTARGPVIDEAALAEALHAGTIFGAGLDVFEREPHIHERLLSAPNVSMTPHFGSANTQCRAQMTALTAANIRRVLDGQPPLTPVA